RAAQDEAVMAPRRVCRAAHRALQPPHGGRFGGLAGATCPRLTPADWAWVQAIGARHDARYYRVVDPHFTLVFRVQGVAGDALVAHVEGQVKGLERISFVLRRAVTEKDAFSAYTHGFLVPDGGYAAILARHDRLYTGVPAAQRRTDISF